MSDTALAPPQTDWLTEAAKIAELPSHPQHTTLRDTQRVYRMLKAVADGNYLETACKIAGFAKQTLYDWKTYAKDGEIAAIAIVDALEKAEAYAEGEMVNCVRGAAKAGPQYWAAGMTYLERRQPDRWGKRQDDSNTPKVVVQIGVQQGDVSVSFASAPPSPQVIDLGSESHSIPSVIPSESDKQDYVNEAKSLTVETLAVPERKRSERKSRPAKGSVRRGKSKGTHPR